MTESAHQSQSPRDPTVDQENVLPGSNPDALLAAVAQGDERAFEQFYDDVAGKIMGVARAILRDAAQADELTERVLLELWCTASHYSPEQGDAVTWAITLAHRRAVDLLRATRAGIWPDAVVTIDAHHRNLTDQGTRACAVEDDRRLRKGCAELTEAQYEVIMLAYFQGQTCDQIDNAGRLPAATTAGHLRSSLIRLRNLLDGNTAQYCDTQTLVREKGC